MQSRFLQIIKFCLEDVLDVILIAQNKSCEKMSASDLTTSCGLFKWRPKWLQKFARKEVIDNIIQISV